MKFNINTIITQALKEDQSHNDITTRALIDKDKISGAVILFREEGIVCGLEIVKKLFKKLDPKASLRFYYADGDKVRKNRKVLYIKAKTRALLSGERVALNFLGFLSGIATLTHAYVREVSPYKVEILDTRKTIPGFRDLAKWAVRCGGGTNHRYHLKEMVMIKDNHRMANRQNMTIHESIQQVRQKTSKRIEVEVDNISQFKEAIDARPDIILLDNMSISQMNKAVSLNKKRKMPCLLEASGGVNLRNIRSIAQTGVQRISVGALTHAIKAIDVSMEIAISHRPSAVSYRPSAIGRRLK